MDQLNSREIDLIEKLGLMKGLLESYDRILLCMCVRLGGAVKLDHKEMHYDMQNYMLEKTIRCDDLTQDVTINARLK